MKNSTIARESISKSLKRRKGIRTNAGIAERNPWLGLEQIRFHCDEYFFKPRGMPITEAGFGEFFQH